MKNLPRLFRLLELTRSQPQYGYTVAGIKKAELSDLAQHHYLVAIMAWQLALAANAAGGKLSVEKVLEFSLIHDLGELFGGDIAMPYARANPEARRKAKAFEAENQKFVAGFFGPQGEKFLALSTEINDAGTDEALVSKLADYAEVTHYKQYMGKLTQGDVKMAAQAMQKKLAKMHDRKAAYALRSFLRVWTRALLKGRDEELFEQAKLLKI
ncbi:MAG TPA: HD domain-containing protein [Patescibacteria group bacterium]|nr:HD domain-containing protein [Patescibacteria group bacterium]